MSELETALAASDFLPHGTCYLWSPLLLLLHVGSDILIGIAYAFIPIGVLYFLRKRRDLPFGRWFILFALVFAACGSTHFLGAWTVWFPNYWLSGFTKLITALISLIAAFALLPLIPKILLLPNLEKTLEDLEIANAALVDHRNRLARSEQLFRTIFEQAAVGAALIETASGRFTRINQRYCDMVGRPSKEMTQKTFQEITHPDDLRQNLDKMAALVGGHIPSFSMENRYFHRNGQIVWVNLTVSPTWSASETPTHHIAIVEEITERKRAEERNAALESQLRQSQKMEAVGLLAGGVAHDFNNILGAVLGYCELGLMAATEGSIARVATTGSPLPPGAPPPPLPASASTPASQSEANAALSPPALSPRDALEKIVSSSLRARDLVRQLLAFSRRTELAKENHDPGVILREAVDFLRATLPVTVEIRSEINLGEGVVHCDPTQIHQVLINLGGNAAQAMAPHGGRLTIGCRRVRLNAMEAESLGLQPGPHFLTTVQDTGPGAPPEVLERLFEPFFTTKDAGQGTGLGLAVAHGVIHGHHGAIQAKNSPEGGALFSVWLPCAAGGPTSRPALSASREPLAPGSGRILLVDDEPALVEVNEKMIRALGYQTHSFGNPWEAWRAFEREPGAYTALVTDQTMPEMTGVELARRVWGIRPQLPIVICTGFSEAISPSEAKRRGFADYLEKPVSLATLREALARIHRGPSC